MVCKQHFISLNHLMNPVVQVLLKCAIHFSISFHWYAFLNFCTQISRQLVYGVHVSSKASVTTEDHGKLWGKTIADALNIGPTFRANCPYKGANSLMKGQHFNQHYCFCFCCFFMCGVFFFTHSSVSLLCSTFGSQPSVSTARALKGVNSD